MVMGHRLPRAGVTHKEARVLPCPLPVACLFWENWIRTEKKAAKKTKDGIIPDAQARWAHSQSRWQGADRCPSTRQPTAALPTTPTAGEARARRQVRTPRSRTLLGLPRAPRVCPADAPAQGRTSSRGGQTLTAPCRRSSGPQVQRARGRRGPSGLGGRAEGSQSSTGTGLSSPR